MNILDLKINLNYLLFWKKHNFHMIYPNTTKQTHWPPKWIKLFVSTKNVISHTSVKVIGFQSFYEYKYLKIIISFI